MTDNATAAYLAKEIYNTLEEGASFGPNNRYTTLEVTRENLSSGYYGAVIFDSVDNRSYLVNRGTQPTTYEDLRADLDIVVGGIPQAQFSDAESLLANYVSGNSHLDNYIPVTNTAGHSLGGYLSQLIGIAYNFDIVTVGSPGAQAALNDLETIGFGQQVQTFNYSDKLTNIISEHDPVGNYGQHIVGGNLQVVDFDQYVDQSLDGIIVSAIVDASKVVGLGDEIAVSVLNAGLGLAYTVSKEAIKVGYYHSNENYFLAAQDLDSLTENPNLDIFYDEETSVVSIRIQSENENTQNVYEFEAPPELVDEIVASVNQSIDEAKIEQATQEVSVTTKKADGSEETVVKTTSEAKIEKFNQLKVDAETGGIVIAEVNSTELINGITYNRLDKTVELADGTQLVTRTITLPADSAVPQDGIRKVTITEHRDLEGNLIEAQRETTFIDQNGLEHTVTETTNGGNTLLQENISAVDGTSVGSPVLIAPTNELIRPDADVTAAVQFIGGAAGGLLADKLADGDALQTIAYKAVLNTITDHFGSFTGYLAAGGSFQGAVNYATKKDVFDGAPDQAADRELLNQPEITETFLKNLSSLSASTLSNVIVDEVGEALGIDGTIGGEIFNVAAGTVTTGVIQAGFGLRFDSLDGGAFSTLLKEGFDFSAPIFDRAFVDPDLIGPVDPRVPNTTVGDSIQLQLTNALAAYAGSRLAGEILEPESQQAAIFGSIGSGLGAAIGGGSIAAGHAISKIFTLGLTPGGPIGIAIGAFIGTIGGTFLGNIFGGGGDSPQTWAKIHFNKETGEYQVGQNWAKGGASEQASKQMADAVTNFVNEVIDITGGSLRSTSGAGGATIGMYRDTFELNVRGRDFKFDRSGDAIEKAAFALLKNFDVVGGHAVVMRAWHNSDAQNLQEFKEDLEVAEAFQLYLTNPTGILALMMDQPDSELAQSWAAILKRAAELELHLPHEKDLDGGWSELLLARGDIDPESIPEIEGDTIILTDPVTGEETVLHHVIGPGYEIVRIEGTDGNDIIEVIVDGPSISYVDAGAGDDVIEGSDERDVILGGSGDDTINGNDGDDWLHGQDGNDVINGNGGLDLISGGDDDDILLGSEDSDHIYGGFGNDQINGGDGLDYLYGGAGDDIIDAGGNRARNELYGEDGNDTLITNWDGLLFGGNGNDTYVLDGWNNKIHIERDEGHDTVIINDGGGSIIFDQSVGPNEIWMQKEGRDLKLLVLGENQSVTVKDYFPSNGSIAKNSRLNLWMTKDFKTAGDYTSGSYQDQNMKYYNTFELDPSNPYFRAQMGNGAQPSGEYNVISDSAFAHLYQRFQETEYIPGNNLQNVRFGDADSSYNRDVLFNYGTTASNDYLDGRVENNGYNEQRETILGSSGADQIRISTYLANNTNDGLENFYIYGDTGNDIIYGGNTRSKQGDTIVGGLGDDTIYGDNDVTHQVRGGTDYIYGGHGNDRIDGMHGDDFLYGGHGDDWISGHIGNDLIYGGIGNDWIGGYFGDDEIYGEDGDDYIQDFHGNNYISAGNGDDRVVVFSSNTSSSQNVINGDAGNDFIDATDTSLTNDISGGAGDDAISGGSGSELLNGDAGNDTINGGAGDDEIHGGDGDDILIGGEGDDELHGGDGDDIYVIESVDKNSSYITINGGVDHAVRSDRIQFNDMRFTDGDFTIALNFRMHRERTDDQLFNFRTSDPNQGIHFYNNPDRALVYFGRDGGASLGYTFQGTDWHEVVMVYTAETGNFDLYHNGGFVRSYQFQANKDFGDIGTLTIAQVQDVYQNPNNPGGAAADYSSFKIWDKALDPTEVSVRDMRDDAIFDLNTLETVNGKAINNVNGAEGDIIGDVHYSNAVVSEDSDGEIEEYLSLKGHVNSYVSIDDTSVMPSTAMTINVSFRTTSTKGSAIASYGVPGSYNEIIVFNPAALEFHIGGRGLNTNIALNDGEWHDLTITWDQSGVVNIYDNGVHIFQGTKGQGNVIESGGEFIIGQEQDSLGGGFQDSQAFDGDIGHLRLWDHVLDTQEIVAGHDRSDAIYDFVFDNVTGTTVQNLTSSAQATVIGEHEWSAITLSPENAILAQAVDVISDSSGYDTLSFGGGIAWDDVSLFRSVAMMDDLLVYAHGVHVATVQNHFDGQGIESFKFSDGAVVEADEYPVTLIGTDGDDTAIYPDEFMNIQTFDGKAGQDRLVLNLTQEQYQAREMQRDIIRFMSQVSGSGAASTAAFLFVILGLTAIDFEELDIFVDAQAMNLGESVIVGSAEAEVLAGTAGHDVIDGAEGVDILHGGAGRDYIAGGAGGDQIAGDDGNDVLFGESGDDRLNGGMGEDTIYGGEGNDTVLAGSENDVIHGDTGADELHGQDGDDVMFGGDSNDILSGGFGNDIMYGGEGDDLLYGDEGNDHLIGGKGNDHLYGGDGADLIDGGDGTDIAYYTLASEAVHLDLLNSENSVSEAAGDVLISIERIIGSQYDDRFIGDGSIERFYGRNGHDYISGGDGQNYLYGDAGNDHLYGDEGDDLLDGGAGNDFVFGGAGADSIISSLGNDSVYGGEGNDVYLSSDRVEDHVFGVLDKDTVFVRNTAQGYEDVIGDVEEFSFIGNSFTLQEIKNMATIIFNKAPVTVDDAITIDEDSVLNFDPLDNDSDPDGDDIHIVSFTDPSLGIVTQEANGTLTYTAHPGAFGTDSFTYMIEDPSGEQAVATVTVTINAVNDAPVAGDLAFSVDEDNDLILTQIQLLNAASDVDVGDSLTAINVQSADPNITITDNGDGTFTLIPANDFYGDIDLTYDVTDGQEIVSANINLTVNPINDAPVATPSNGVIHEDGSMIISSLGISDIDTDLADITIEIKNLPSHGVLSLNGGALSSGGILTAQDVANGLLSYRPGQDQNDDVTFSFIVSDGTNTLAEQSVSIRVQPVDDPFTAIHDVMTFQGDLFTFDVTANDENPDGDKLIIESIDVPKGFQGIMSYQQGTGLVTVQPVKYFFGEIVSFDVTLTNGSGETSTSSVTLTREHPDITHSGTSGDDVLDGNSSANFILTGAGNDDVRGKSGDDLIDGGAGNDILRGGNGDDILFGGAGSDRILGGSGDDIIIGDGSAFINPLTGTNFTSSNKILETDVLSGGTGSDRFVFGSLDRGDKRVITDFEVGIDKVDVLALHEFVMINSSSSSVPSHIDENGNVVSRPGSVRSTQVKLEDAFVFIQDGADVLLAYKKFGKGLTYSEDDAVLIFENANAAEFTFEEVFIQDDNVASDIVQVAAKGPNSLKGHVIKDPSQDEDIEGNVDENAIVGSAQAETLRGTDSNDVIFGEGGDDRLNGGMGEDTIYGGKGNDTVLAGSENDVIHGDAGADELHGQDGDDVIYGGDSNDILSGGFGHDILYGGSGSDVLYGDEGDDILYGSKGNDFLFGGEGDDILIGGSGRDRYTTGEGQDTIVLSGDDFGKVDHVKDFDINNDKIDISQILEHHYDPLSDAITDFVKLTSGKKGTFLRVDQDGDGDQFTKLLLVKGVNISDDTQTLIDNGTLIVDGENI